MLNIDHTKESIYDGVGVSEKRYLQIFDICEMAICGHIDALSALDYAQKAIKPKNSAEYFLIGFTFVDIISQLDCLNHSKTN